MDTFIQQANEVGFDFAKVLAGLAIFLFGIKTMGDSLKVLAGPKMKSIIDRSTTNPVKGVFVGALVTGLLQSSSGTTALAISLVRAGLMNLKQAVGIIMGANIGTTVTAILIGFKISEYAPYILIVGAFMLMFSHKHRTHHIALLIFSFGALFYGLDVMGSALKVLAHMPMFGEFAVTISHNKILGLFLGTGMTLVIQSSSATIGILQSLYGDGLITLQGALPILFGDNIGTTITAVLAAIGGSVAARRAAAAHVIFNVVGTICFMLIFGLFYNYVVWGAQTFNLNPAMQIAFAHASFNITTTVLLLPFIGVLVWIVTKIIRDDESEEKIHRVILDEKLIDVSAPDAVTAAYANAVEMANMTRKMSTRTKQYIFTRDIKARDRIPVYEEVVNDYNKQIGKYLVKIGENELDPLYNQLQTNLIYSIKDIERIGDHFTNLMYIFDQIFDAKEVLTDKALTDLNAMFDLIDELIDDTIQVLDHSTPELIAKIQVAENKLDRLNEDAKDRFVERYKGGELSGEIGATVFVDALSELERIGDHCENIALRLNIKAVK